MKDIEAVEKALAAWDAGEPVRTVSSIGVSVPLYGEDQSGFHSIVFEYLRYMLAHPYERGRHIRYCEEMDNAVRPAIDLPDNTYNGWMAFAIRMAAIISENGLDSLLGTIPPSAIVEVRRPDEPAPGSRL